MRVKFGTHTGNRFAAVLAMASLLALGACSSSGTSGKADTSTPTDGTPQDVAGADGGDQVSDIAPGDLSVDSGQDLAGDTHQVDVQDTQPIPDGTDLDDTAELDTDAIADVAEVVPDVPPPHSLVSLEIAPASPWLPQGGTLQMTAKALYSDDATEDVTQLATWSVEDPFVAQVSNAEGTRGLVTGMAMGETLVRATFGSVNKSVQIFVKIPSVVSLEIKPSEATVFLTQTKQLEAVALYDSGLFENVTNDVIWDTSDGAVASVSNELGTMGLATGLAVGPATIHARDMATGKSAQCQLTVEEAPLALLTIEPAEPSMVTGSTLLLRVRADYTPGFFGYPTTGVVWSSEDSSIASVSNDPGLVGVATGGTPGTALVTAEFGGQSTSTHVTVTQATLLYILVTPEGPVAIVDDQSVQFAATGFYSNSTTQDLTTLVAWTTGDDAVLDVSGTGLAVGDWLGSTYVRATYADKWDESPVNVTLKNGRYCDGDSECGSGKCDVPYFTAPGGFCCDQYCNQNGCNGCNTGTCQPLAAGTDYLSACGLYFCDGNGACKTSCVAGAGNCSSDCQGGWCWEGKCLAPLPTGSACLGGCQCQSGVCGFYVFWMACT